MLLEAPTVIFDTLGHDAYSPAAPGTDESRYMSRLKF